MPSDDQPTVYVIAGPNGAGKTTFATRFLPEFVNCKEFLNADLIAAGLSPFAPESQSLRAGRLLLDRTRELAKSRTSFGFETTLAGRIYLKLFRQFQDQGYRITIFFIALPDAESAICRVANRVQQGGHFVPEEEIRRRFRRGANNFLRYYRDMADFWQLYSGAGLTPQVIAEGDGSVMTVWDKKHFDEFVDRHPEGQA